MNLIGNFIDEIKKLHFIERIKWLVILSLIVIVIVLSMTVVNLSSNRVHRISIPPKLEFGKIVKTGEIDSHEVYTFAGYILQQLYYWGDNGEKDFKKNINRLSAFLTPGYRGYLLKQYNNLANLGELKNRERTLQSLQGFNNNMVVRVKAGWQVSVDYHLQEHIEDKRFKSFHIRYFMNVVVRDVNPEINPWGLQLDIPNDKPVRLK